MNLASATSECFEGNAKVDAHQKHGTGLAIGSIVKKWKYLA